MNSNNDYESFLESYNTPKEVDDLKDVPDFYAVNLTNKESFKSCELRIFDRHEATDSAIRLRDYLKDTHEVQFASAYQIYDDSEVGSYNFQIEEF